MYSNIITPPDFVENNLHTVTIINCEDKDIELIYYTCKILDKSINIYLYKSAMDNQAWLDKAIEKSNHIVVNDVDQSMEKLFLKENVYYFGLKNYVCPATKINNLLDYFNLLQNN